jgi:hypothetical protein
VAGRVDDVDAVVFPLARHGGGGDGDAALALLVHVIGGGVAVVHLTDLVRHARVIQDPLGRGGLARVDMRGDADVADFGERMVRFGLGSTGSEPPPADPSAWLLNQLRQPDWPWPGPQPSTEEGLAAVRADRETKPPPGESQSRALYRAQGLAAVGRAVATKTPFRERLVWFWTNHFTVSLRRGQCAAVAGAFVQEAIRPHVTGRFEDMLLAVMRHPAMLLYLDNAQSVGPDSMGGQISHRGLNENLARECLELHTVSADAGYTQADVTSFARILTGWSIDVRNEPLGSCSALASMSPAPRS